MGTECRSAWLGISGPPPQRLSADLLMDTGHRSRYTTRDSTQEEHDGEIGVRSSTHFEKPTVFVAPKLDRNKAERAKWDGQYQNRKPDEQDSGTAGTVVKHDHSVAMNFKCDAEFAEPDL